ELRRKHVHGGLDAGERRTGAQTSDNGVPAVRREHVAWRLGEDDVQPRRDLTARTEIRAEALRQDSDDEHADVVHLNRTADDVGGAVEAALPNLVADHHAASPSRADV